MSLPERVGRYRVQALIGTGGFATVLRAYDETLDDSVAIKILAENWATDPDLRERFIEEARLLRRIRSDDLVTVHDVGELEDGRPYFVMTFAERGSLSDRLESRATRGLDPPSARKLIETLAGGLGALHSAGIVHRDVNPRNLLIRPTGMFTEIRGRRAAATQVRAGLLGTDERLLLGDLGLAKDFLRSGEAGASVVGGTPDYVSPEQLDITRSVGPAADIYGATGVMFQALTGRRPPRPSALRAAVNTLDEGWRDFFVVGMAANPEERFADIEAWRDAALRLSDEAEALGSPGIPDRAVRISSNPYKGLAAFQPEDAALFFGRDELVGTLVERLGRDRVLTVGGPSGSGKSSAVRAGLVPAVAAGALPGSERWPVALFTPRSDPNAELTYQLARLSRSTTHTEVVVPGPLQGRPRDEARFLADEITDAFGGLLVVVDQFEELFTQNGRPDQEEFIATLGSITDPTESRVRLVIVVRADFYGAAAGFEWLAERITSNQVLVGPMTRAELRESIEQPAFAAGLRLEPGLVDQVLADGGNEPSALPLVSHAMAETWRRRNGSTLTLDGYITAGGVAGAIAQTAESVYGGRFDDVEKEVCRRLMLRLVAPGEGRSDSRRRVPMSSLDADEVPDRVAEVAAELVEARLLTVDEDSIEIAHEALLRTWPRLRQWIDDARDDLRMRQRISYAASEWISQERHPDLLYRGTPLQAALEWKEEHGDVLDGPGKEFLDASEEAYLAAERVAEEQERRARRIRRTAITVLATTTVAAFAASIVAFGALNQATSRFGQSLATQAAALVDSDPRAAAALAVEAIARGESESLDARTALVESAQRLESVAFAPAASPVVVGDALSIAVSPDGRLIATGTRDGSLQLWDDRSQPMGQPIPGHDKAINEISFTPAGDAVITAGDDGLILMWDVSQPREVPSPVVLGEAGRLAWSVDVAPDGSTAATASEDGIILIWDVERMEAVEPPLADSERDFLTVAFSPDGSLLLAGNGRGEVMGWSMPGREMILDPFNAHQSDVWEIVFDATGQFFATASSDGRVRIWETADGTLIGEPFQGAAQDVRGVQMLPGERVVAGDERGRVWTSDFTGAVRSSVPGPHRGQVVDASLGEETLASLGQDQRMQVWKAAGFPSAAVIDGFVEGAFGVAVSPSGDRIAVGDGEGGIVILSPDGEIVSELAGVHSGQVWGLSFDETGTSLASSGADGVVVVNDLTTGGSARYEIGSPVPVVLFDGERVIAGSADGVVRVFDAAGIVAELEGHLGGATGMAVSPDGMLAVSDRGGHLTIWDMANTSAPVEAFLADDNTVWNVAWSNDGDLLAAASADETALIWDVETMELVSMLAPHGQGALDLEFLDDGVTLAATSGDGSIRLWDIVLSRPVGAALIGHEDASWRIASFPDSSKFVTTGTDGSVRIWNVLDLSTACERVNGAFDEEHQRRSLGEGETPVGCATD